MPGKQRVNSSNLEGFRTMLSLDRAGVVVAPPASFRVGSVPECYEFFRQRARNPALVTSPLNLQDVTSFTKHRSTDVPRIQQFSLRTKGEIKLSFFFFFFFFLVSGHS